MVLFVLCPLYMIGAGDGDHDGKNANGPSKSVQPPSDPQIGKRGWTVHYGYSTQPALNSSGINGNFSETLSLD